ncbi:cysteine desulfurase [Actinomyces sp. zg-332]|uniref:cysteine desulfurase family protein n=1 Tax=Actinomyces sp. zg-332 TaxID=2708340 RepID=UPI001422C8BE|nr:cysteine desulfurase family protein [Actinomyces sp. zg-332]QPK93832.1 cysteine desulfurase [Actinomyces sp. zg-332]
MYLYLDHSASSPMLLQVQEVYLKSIRDLYEQPGNPSALHKGGLLSRDKLEKAREDIAHIFAIKPSEVLFTSGGTESDNLGFVSVARKVKEKTGRKIAITTAIEHPAILSSEAILKKFGIDLIKIPVLNTGVIDIDAFKKILEENYGEISVISIGLVNNETGVIQPVKDLVELVRDFESSVLQSERENLDKKKQGDRIYIHTDAVQAFGNIEVDFKDLGVDALSISGHKIGAPVGIGILLAKQDLPMLGLYAGGGQERGIRSGTIDICGAIAISKACIYNVQTLSERIEKYATFKKKIIENLPEGIKPSTSGDSSPHILHLVCQYGGADAMLFALDNADICVSAGSACRAGVAQSSYVLQAMGYDDIFSSGGLRISFGHTTVMEDIDKFINALPNAVKSARMLQNVRDKHS